MKETLIPSYLCVVIGMYSLHQTMLDTFILCPGHLVDIVRRLSFFSLYPMSSLLSVSFSMFLISSFSIVSLRASCLTLLATRVLLCIHQLGNGIGKEKKGDVEGAIVSREPELFIREGSEVSADAPHITCTK